MIIALVSQEKNLGLLTLTDFLISKLGHSNTVVYGWNYLLPDSSAILEKLLGRMSVDKNLFNSFSSETTLSTTQKPLFSSNGGDIGNFPCLKYIIGMLR